MALSLFNINVNVKGDSTRFFNKLEDDLVIAEDTTVAVGGFVDDTGTTATAFPVVTNGYVNLYINGVLQERDAYEVTTTELTFHENVEGSTILAGTPLVLEFVELTTIV